MNYGDLVRQESLALMLFLSQEACNHYRTEKEMQIKTTVSVKAVAVKDG